jgi:transposase
MPLYIRNREEFESQVITMHSDGSSIRQIARHFGVGRNTVRRMLRCNRKQRDKGHSVLPPKIHRKSKLTPFIPAMKALIEKFPNITGVRLIEELRLAGYKGGATIVTDRLRSLRPKPKKEPTMRFETAPGYQGQMDWSPYTIPFVRSGKATVLCFSYILGFSRRQYIDFTTDRKFFTLIRRHQDAFAHFGGVPQTCLYDGEKTVLLRWEAGQPIFNPAFIAFITHYRCRPVACKPRRPKTKGKVEAPFWFVERNLLNGREFQDLEDLRACARWWLKERSDMHLHETTGRMPIERFLAEEQSALLPLPLHPYDSSEVALRVCRTDGFLEHDTNLYSVPYEYVADILTLKATENEIFIYSPDLDLIASHPRLPLGYQGQQEDPAHRKSPKIRYGLEPVRQAFLQLGPSAEVFLQGLKNRYPRNCGFHARHILSLKASYHADDIHRAIVHATAYHAFEGKAIERILKVRAVPRPLESSHNRQAKKLLGELLPEITQRPLAEYGELLGTGENTHAEN